MDEMRTVTAESSYFTNNSLLFRNNKIVLLLPGSVIISSVYTMQLNDLLSFRIKSNIEILISLFCSCAIKLVNLFCLGSPLPVFLALRGIRPGSYTNQDTILPRRLCPRIFNIYHPADPVAYRLEPLILKHYSSIQPALIHRADAINKPDYDHIDLVASSGKEVKRHRLSDCYRTETDDASSKIPVSPRKNDQGEPPQKQMNRQRSPSIHRASFASRFFGFFRGSSEIVHLAPAARDETPEANGESEPREEHSSTFEDNVTPSFQLLSDDISDELDYSNPVENHTGSQNGQLLSDSEFTATSLQLDHRIDFQLRASRYENMYISFLTSHTSYWTNADVGMLIMTQLFGAIRPPK
ncbi:Phospholipase DDHD1 [Fasciola gigantica]|uniref:Phospholipase DDHD1 n=1 Tax=Fasciola gigantica TaxID=46835 RepID=A0A504YUM4_FASGI|nr:Phospholipase DDHD1 [Fasciola gigantica]